MVSSLLQVEIQGKTFRCDTDADIDTNIYSNYISTGMIRSIESLSRKPFLLKQRRLWTNMIVQTPRNHRNYIILGTCFLLLKVENQFYLKKFFVIQCDTDILLMKNFLF